MEMDRPWFCSTDIVFGGIGMQLEYRAVMHDSGIFCNMF